MKIKNRTIVLLAAFALIFGSSVKQAESFDSLYDNYGNYIYYQDLAFFYSSYGYYDYYYYGFAIPYLYSYYATFYFDSNCYPSGSDYYYNWGYTAEASGANLYMYYADYYWVLY